MPRQQSQSRSSSTVSTSRPSLPPPKIWYSTPSPPAPMMQQPTLMDSVKQGVGLGAGSAIGHRIVASLFGPTNPPAMPPPATQSLSAPLPTAPYYASESYTACLEVNKNNQDICKPFLSKDKSPWTQCMEMNFYRAEFCTPESTTSTSR